ncbi:MAG: hypothetical protein KBC66_03245 [Kiritimatiellae bacterium]|jgi:hypothetical protein|nr:hypothetical protein [Kiritimatiellia bacterium]NLD89172.1 hypothetical protein [Lentisphaerota bacterium]HQQ60254.1 hypothetical protein [Kiritimatiellia bacterium]
MKPAGRMSALAPRKFFHTVEKNGLFFHTMEKSFGDFPHNGKNVSTVWKNDLPAAGGGG